MAVVISMTLTGRNEVRVDHSRPLLSAVYTQIAWWQIKVVISCRPWRARTHRICTLNIQIHSLCSPISWVNSCIRWYDATDWYLELTSPLVRKPFRAVVPKHLSESVWRINRWFVYYAALFACVISAGHYANPASSSSNCWSDYCVYVCYSPVIRQTVK